MPNTCSAVECKDYGPGSKKFTVYQAPANYQKIWRERISRRDPPAVIFLCGKHFEESWFCPSRDMENKFRSEKGKSIISEFLSKSDL